MLDFLCFLGNQKETLEGGGGGGVVVVGGLKKAHEGHQRCISDSGKYLWSSVLLKYLAVFSF